MSNVGEQMNHATVSLSVIAELVRNAWDHVEQNGTLNGSIVAMDSLIEGLITELKGDGCFNEEQFRLMCGYPPEPQCPGVV